MDRRQVLLAGLATAGWAGIGRAAELDVVSVASTQQGNWDTSVVEMGQRSGIFRKHGLDLQIIWTQGGAEAQQAVIAGSAEIATAVGIMGVFSAFSKGAPLRIIGNETSGAADIFWYVQAKSPITSIKDLKGETIAYSTTGSSSHSVVQAFVKSFNLDARPIATGGAQQTLIQTMSGQVGVGWSAVPFGLEQLDRGEIRILATGNDAPGMRDRTVRVNVANVQTLTKRAGVVDRFMQAYRETLAWMYDGDKALATYAAFAGVSLPIARRARDDFFPREALDPNRIVGMDTVLSDALGLKYIAAPLKEADLRELIRIPQGS